MHIQLFLYRIFSSNNKYVGFYGREYNKSIVLWFVMCHLKIELLMENILLFKI